MTQIEGQDAVTAQWKYYYLNPANQSVETNRILFLSGKKYLDDPVLRWGVEVDLLET